MSSTPVKLFAPIGVLTGSLRRHRPALEEERLERLKGLPPLAPPCADPRWHRTDFSPHQHSRLTPLIDGHEYFADLTQTLKAARERVTICAWCLTPRMAMRHDEEAAQEVGHLLNEVAERADVYLLLWSGAPALFEPTVEDAERTQQLLHQLAPRVQCVLDRRAKFSHDHHQKAVTVDGRVAYVGGMDLTTFQGDRWDKSSHELRFGPNWHDAQIKLEGEIVDDVEKNFCQRWNESSPDHLEPLSPPQLVEEMDVSAQVVRTIPAGVYDFAPDGIYGIYHALTTAIAQAERFIYLENQYLWAPEIVDALISTMNRRGTELRIVLVLPAHAYTGRYDNDRRVEDLRRADNGRGIFEAYSLYASGPAMGRTGFTSKPIYVHAKVSVVDDEWLSIGSANLNRRGLAADTEMNVQAISGEAARKLRLRLWSEHLGLPVEALEERDPIEVIDREWKEVARRNAECARHGSPPEGGQAVRYEVKGGVEGKVLDVLQSISLEH